MKTNGPLTCGDSEALVSYLYDECDPAERVAIETHLASCETCSRELEGLRGVRTRLVDWTPPEAELGFRIVRADRLATPRARLTPRWALAAAATVMLAASAAVANVELRVGLDGVTVRTGRARPSEPASGATDRPWRADLVALERTLRGELAAVANRSQAAAPAAPGRSGQDADAVLRRVRVLLEESERRQEQELALRVAQLTREIEANRQADLVQIRQGFGRLAGVTGAEVARQRELMNYLIRVSQR